MCLSGNWAQWCPFSLDRKEAEHKLAAVTPFGASKRVHLCLCHDIQPGDKRSLFLW